MSGIGFKKMGKPMEKPKPTKTQRKKEIEILLRQGLSQTHIARLYGLSVSSISLYAKELRIPGNRDWYKSRNLIIEMYVHQGMRQVDIARKLGITRQRVSEIVKKYAHVQ
jgi:predicted transcriptional regulator